MKAKPKIFSGAFSRLREALGETQEGMAHRLGMSLSGWQRWEYGQRRLRGAALQAVLNLCDQCPNAEELRRAFTATSEISHLKQASSQAVRVPIDIGEDEEPEYVRNAPPQIRQMYRETLANLRSLQGEANRGNHAAAEALRMLAEMWGRAAFVTSNPERPRGRRAPLDKEVLRLLSELGH
jgi:transcriptional regulator with XRE-family HTH domain